LEPLVYDFRRNGRIDALQTEAAKLALARKDEEITDLKKQLREKTRTRELAEKLATIAENAPGEPGTPKGKAETRSEAEILADPRTPIDKLMEIRRRQRGG
jgi:hypothetical protein